MSSANQSTTAPRGKLRSAGKMQVSRYDKVSGMLIAMLVLFGSLAGIMVVVWLTSRIFVVPIAVEVKDQPIANSDNALPGSADLDTPAEDPLDKTEPAETLAAVADAVANKLSMLDRKSKGNGKGDGRGGGGGGKARRWEIRYPEGMTTKTYGKLLDHFKIELGVVQPGGKVAYAKNFSGGNPTARTAASDGTEGRYYFWERSKNLRPAKEALLAQAGIGAKGKIILEFISKDLEGQLIQLMNTKAGTRKDKIYKTIFGVIPDGNGYKFYVLDQRYK